MNVQLIQKQTLIAVLVFALMQGSLAQAQLGASMASSSVNRAIQLPLSGRAATLSGSVTVQQSPVPGNTRTVNTLNPNLQVQGNFSGSVVGGTVTAEPLSLSLKQALEKAFAYNLGDITSANQVRQAKGQRYGAISALLPNVSANFQLVRQRISLVAAGIQFPKIPGFPGIPVVTDPFNYYDLRVSGSQSLFDLTAWGNYRAAQHNVEAAQFSEADAKDLVTLAVTGSYLQVLASAARVDSAQAQLATAKALHQKAQDLYQAGLNAKIDATRSQVELQMQQQRLTTQQLNYEKQLLTLKRLIGLPLAQTIQLSDQNTFTALNPELLNLDKTVEKGMQNRSDLKAAEAQVKAAQSALLAARAEHLPTASISANYGLVGNSPSQGNGVFGVVGLVNMPIFQGGRIHGDVMQAMAILNQRKAEFEETKSRVEYDIRNALLDLNASESQVKLSQSNQDLASQALTQSQDRFAAGVTDTIEVVQSQEALANSAEDYIASVYAYNLAKASLARAMGLTNLEVNQQAEAQPNVGR